MNKIMVARICNIFCAVCIHFLILTADCSIGVRLGYEKKAEARWLGYCGTSSQKSCYTVAGEWYEGSTLAVLLGHTDPFFVTVKGTEIILQVVYACRLRHRHGKRSVFNRYDKYQATSQLLEEANGQLAHYLTQIDHKLKTRYSFQVEI